MTSTNLDKLGVVMGIANRLEADLRQLKEWIKTQFENEAQNDNDMIPLDLTYSSKASASAESSSIDDNDKRVDQEPETLCVSYGILTLPKSESIEENEGQELEIDPENDEEFILGDNFEPEDPLDNGPNEMMDEYEPMMPHLTPEVVVQDSRVECEICHSRHKNRHALHSHKYNIHGGGARKREAAKKFKASSSSTTITSKNSPNMLKRKLKVSAGTEKKKLEKCFICGKRFNAPSSRFDHLQREHFVCGHSQCRLQFPSYEALTEHRKNAPLHQNRSNPKKETNTSINSNGSGLLMIRNEY